MRPGLLAATAFILLGCPSAVPGPRDTLDRYVESTVRGDCRTAYELMSEEYRAEATREDFCEALRTSPAEVRDSVEALRRVAGQPEVTARLRYGLGDELSFVLEDGEWRIDSPVFEFYRQTTPREALRSFVRAVERRRYDVVLAFVPEQYRERMSADGIRELWEGDQREEILQLLENLRASLDEPIEEVGERASMQYMDRYTCRFVREGGVWRIEDPD